MVCDQQSDVKRLLCRVKHFCFRLRGEFLSFVIRLDFVPVVTQSSTPNMQMRITPLRLFAYLSVNVLNAGGLIAEFFMFDIPGLCFLRGCRERQRKMCYVNTLYL